MTHGSIIVFGAMGAEIECLRGRVEDRNDPREKIRVVKTGIGKINAAIVAYQEVFSHLVNPFEPIPPCAVFLVGTAGAIDPKLKVGDLVISTDVLQHDMDVTPLGFERGQTPFDDQWKWSADEQLVAIANSVAKEQGIATHIGRILTGDRFVADPKEATELHKTLGGLCLDMEGAAIAKVCSLVTPPIPWVILRFISDTADHNSPISFQEFLPIASKRIADLVLALAQRSGKEMP